MALTAQNHKMVERPSFFKSELDGITENRIISALDSLYDDMSDFNLSDQYLTNELKELTSSALRRYLISPLKRKKLRPEDCSYQLINLYGLGESRFFTSVSIIDKNSSELNYIIDLVATIKDENITFSSPLNYYTRFWKTHSVGNLTYHFRDTIDLNRAKIFDNKNNQIASNLGLSPESFDFYMCYNEQEVLKLMGIAYSSDRNGQTRNGFGVSQNVICSIVNNEDFSHDVFHYYSGKINKREDRNWITEEGIAYLWGNAYYTDKRGEMITHTRLINELNNYLIANPDIGLFQLFEKNTKIFVDIAPEISVQSTISGIIAQEVENRRGMEGILKLINAGSKERLKSYLQATDELIGINKKNFNSKVRKLIKKTKNIAQ